MKQNFDLFRALLMTIEDDSADSNFIMESTANEVQYHLSYLHHEEYIDSYGPYDNKKSITSLARILPKGLALLKSIRDIEQWNKCKEFSIETFGKISFDSIESYFLPASKHTMKHDFDLFREILLGFGNYGAGSNLMTESSFSKVKDHIDRLHQDGYLRVLWKTHPNHSKPLESLLEMLPKGLELIEKIRDLDQWNESKEFSIETLGKISWDAIEAYNIPGISYSNERLENVTDKIKGIYVIINDDFPCLDSNSDSDDNCTLYGFHYYLSVEDAECDLDVLRKANPLMEFTLRYLLNSDIRDKLPRYGVAHLCAPMKGSAGRLVPNISFRAHMIKAEYFTTINQAEEHLTKLRGRNLKDIRGRSHRYTLFVRENA